ncbi:YciI family protein [Isoptericola sp. NPDC055881]
MRYLMLVVEPDVPDREPTPDIVEWVRRHDADGSRVLGERLRPAADVRRVQVRDGRTLVTDGPFTESKEVIGGFDLIEAPDLEAALAIAAGHPGAFGGGTVEVHPYWPTDGADPS